MQQQAAPVRPVIALADDHLVLGHRLSEWCGHAPMLEEDLSLSNMALDLIGQARNLYTYAAELEGRGRTEDDLAYLRSDREYFNLLLVERPNGDFAHTMLRQLYFAVFMELYWQKTATGNDETLAAIAAKAEKEIAYHVRHAAEWVIRLGDGTEESAKRLHKAAQNLHPYTDELFLVTPDLQICIDNGTLPDPESLRPDWEATIEDIFDQACLEVPHVAFAQTGGREGLHTEDFGHLLSELQYVQRTWPGLTW